MHASEIWIAAATGAAWFRRNWLLWDVSDQRHDGTNKMSWIIISSLSLTAAITFTALATTLQYSE
jgi:hypothetical protein